MTGPERIGRCELWQGDCREVLRGLAEESVHSIVTSPPYFGLRDYGIPPSDWPEVTFVPMPGLPPVTVPAMRCCLGLEPDPWAFVGHLVAVFRECRRVLRGDGCLMLNIGDSFMPENRGENAKPRREYPTGMQGQHLGADLPTKRENIRALQGAGIKRKDLLGIPWRLAFALQADGWWLRNDLIWHKPAPMPESVRDRCTRAHEAVFHFAKSERYFWDAEAIAEEAVAKPQNRFTKRVDFPKGSARRPDGVNPNQPEGGGFESSRNARSVWTINTEPFSGWVETGRRVRVPWDAPDDGKKRIASEDCPIHGDHPALAPTKSCDGLEGDRCGHNGGSSIRHEQEQDDDCAPSEMNHTPGSGPDSLDYQRHPCLPFANDHSSESHKTGLSLETSSACTFSAQSGRRIVDRSASRDSGDETARTHESRMEQDDPGGHALEQMPSRNDGTPSSADLSSCTCEWYVEKAEKTSHFAVMPGELARRCVLATTSEAGACAECGAPWGRRVETSRSFESGSGRSGRLPSGKNGQGLQGGGVTLDIRRGPTITRNTTGWDPFCACPPAEPVPCTVLDPFAGAGTTLLAAERLGRRSIGIEASAEFVGIALRRIAGDRCRRGEGHMGDASRLLPTPLEALLAEAGA